MSEDFVVVGVIFLACMILFGGLVLDNNLKNARKHEAFQACILSRGIWVDTQGTGTCVIVDRTVQE